MSKKKKPIIKTSLLAVAKALRDGCVSYDEAWGDPGVQEIREEILRWYHRSHDIPRKILLHDIAALKNYKAERWWRRKLAWSLESYHQAQSELRFDLIAVLTARRLSLHASKCWRKETIERLYGVR